jgi:hypothetical protein
VAVFRQILFCVWEKIRLTFDWMDCDAWPAANEPVFPAPLSMRSLDSPRTNEPVTQAGKIRAQFLFGFDVKTGVISLCKLLEHERKKMLQIYACRQAALHCML